MQRNKLSFASSHSRNVVTEYKKALELKMAHLIRTLVGDNDLNRLEEAYIVLAEAYLAHRNGQTKPAAAESNFEILRDRVLASESRVNVGQLCKPKCDLISTDYERPIELFNNLGQVEVLIAAIKIMRSIGLPPTKSAPTQQSNDDQGNSVADLEGDGWKLEAFGGHNCTSNQKLFEDLCTLKTSQEKDGRMFLAFRQQAWCAAYRTKKLSMDSTTSVGGTTKKLRLDFENRKVNVQADILLKGTQDDIYVCEVIRLDCEPSQKQKR